MPYGWDVFDLTQRDLEYPNYPVWICDLAHGVPSWKPLFMRVWYPNVIASTWYGAGKYCIPRSRGVQWRQHNGYFYLTSHLLTNEDEVKAREPIFRERVAPIINDPWGFWERLKTELKGYYDRFIPLDVERMEDWELISHFRELIEGLNRRVWEIHFDGVCSFDFVFSFFRELCPEVTGLAPYDAKITRMLGGFDNSLFQLNKGIAELATNAVALKLEDNFKLPDEQVLSAMEQSDAGREWLKLFRDFISVHGWRMLRMFEFDTPTWIEKPSLAIAEVKRMLAVGGVHAPDRERGRLRKEGEEIEKELLEKVPAAQREWFKKLIVCAQAAQYFSEDHDYWCELRCYSLIRRAVIEQGKRFVEIGSMDDTEDIHYLFPDHILRGNYLGEVENLRPVVDMNRKEHNGYLARPPVCEEVPLFIGDPSRVGEMLSADPTLAVVAAPRVADPEEVGAACVGAASAPGVVEGIARVIFSTDQWGEVQPGEILVCPTTDANWTPLFGMIKGIVTDSGGTLIHAFIVAREYGIPAVTGCLDATRKIKTGDRIRVDGDLLRVYVLD